jgi:hypothetical protein
MKKCAPFLLLMLLPAFAAGQYMAFPTTGNSSAFDGGVGMTWIDNFSPTSPSERSASGST